MVFSNRRDRCSTLGPFLHTPVSGLPETLLGDYFAADRGCGPCLGLGCSDLLQPYCELCLLGPVGLFPQKVGLLVEELVQGGQISSHLVQRALFLATTFQASHACFPDWGSDGRREEPYWCGGEVSFKNPA
jgi:hypothetical protein